MNNPSLLQLTSSLFFSLTAIFIKFLHRIPPTQTLYIRSVFAIVCLSSMRLNLYPKKYITLLILRGLIGGVGTVCWFQSMQLLPTSEAIVVSKISPLWTSLISVYIIRKNKMTIKLLLSVILSIIGVTLIYRPPFLMHFLGEPIEVEYSYRTLGIICSLISSVTQAFVQVVISQLGTKVNQYVILQYFSLFGIILPMMYQLYSPFMQIVVPGFYESLLLLLVSILGTLAQIFMNHAFAIGNLNRLSLLGQSQVVFSYCLDIFVLRQEIHPLSVIGIILVCACLISK